MWRDSDYRPLIMDNFLPFHTYPKHNGQFRTFCRNPKYFGFETFIVKLGMVDKA